MINRFYNRAPLQFKLSSEPLNLAASALAAAQKRYDTNFEDALKVKQIMINALPADQATANEFRKKYSDRIDEAVKKSNGDYSQITRTIQELRQELVNDLAPGSKYYQVAKNYDAYNNWLKESRESKDIDPNDITGYSNYFFKNYKPVGDPDPAKGYEPLNLPKIPSYKDWMAEAEKSMAGLKPEEHTREIEQLDGKGRVYTTKVKASGITEDRLYGVGASSLLGDPVMRNNLAFKSQYTGIPVDQLYKDYLLKLRDRAKNLAYMSDEHGNKIATDQAYWNALADQRSRQNLDWDKTKHALEHPDLYQTDENSLSRTGAVDIPRTTLAEAGINLSKAMSSEGQQVHKSIVDIWEDAPRRYVYPGSMTNGMFNFLSKFAQTAVELRGGATKTINKDNIFNAPGVNSALLRKIWDSKFNGVEYDPNNKDHVRKAQEVQFEYDQSVKNADSRNVNVVKFGNTNAKAVGETAFRLLSAGATKATSEWDKDKNAVPEWKAGVPTSIREDFASGKIKPSDVQAVGIIPASQGIGQGHAVELVVKGKTILMQLDDLATDPVTKSVADAYSTVFNTQKDGGLIHTGLMRSDGSEVYAQPIVDYVKDGTTWRLKSDLKLFDYKNGEYFPIHKSSVKAPGGHDIDYQFILDNVENGAMKKSMPRIKGADKLGPDIYPH